MFRREKQTPGRGYLRRSGPVQREHDFDVTRDNLQRITKCETQWELTKRENGFFSIHRDLLRSQLLDAFRDCFVNTVHNYG